MKTKKPRSAKAVKAAARPLRRVTRKAAKAPRRKTAPAKTKRAPRKTTVKRPALAKKRTRTTPRTRTIVRRVYRRPRAKSLPISRESESQISPLAAEAEQLTAAVSLPPPEIPVAPTQKLPQASSAQPEPAPRIPEILLEGDEPAPFVTGPGQKYALGLVNTSSHVGHDEAALPEAYGTGQILLAARDPHWLYAHWDLTPQQQRHYNTLSADHHLVVRVYASAVGTAPVKEAHVHPESRHWFVHVDRAATQYVAELGYYRSGRHWVPVAASPPVVTPSDTISADQAVRFATIPANVRLPQLAALAKQAASDELPPAEIAPAPALAELAGLCLTSQERLGSAEIAAAVPAGSQSGISDAAIGLPSSPAAGAESLSSLTAVPEERPAGFWFSVNSELIVYGATEPDATLTMDGWPVQLRPDGTFSFRLALPDGDHTVTLSATSKQGKSRQAQLKITRHTEHGGDVGTAPPLPPTEAPVPEWSPDPGL